MALDRDTVVVQVLAVCLAGMSRWGRLYSRYPTLTFLRIVTVNLLILRALLQRRWITKKVTLEATNVDLTMAFKEIKKMTKSEFGKNLINRLTGQTNTADYM